MRIWKMKQFSKPKNWEEFFIPLQRCANRQKALECIWKTYYFPSVKPNLVFGRNAMLNQVYICILRTTIRITIEQDGEKLYFSLIDKDVCKMTANMIHIAVIIALFQSEGDVYLVFSSEKCKDIVFKNFVERDFQRAYDNYSSLKAYIYLLFLNRRLYIDTKAPRTFPRFNSTEAQEIIMQDSFYATLFYHNFVSEQGYLSNQLRQLHRILQHENFYSSVFYFYSMHAQHLSGISLCADGHSNAEWDNRKLTIFEEMQAVSNSRKQHAYENVAVYETNQATVWLPPVKQTTELYQMASVHEPSIAYEFHRENAKQGACHLEAEQYKLQNFKSRGDICVSIGNPVDWYEASVLPKTTELETSTGSKPPLRRKLAIAVRASCCYYPKISKKLHFSNIKGKAEKKSGRLYMEEQNRSLSLIVCNSSKGEEQTAAKDSYETGKIYTPTDYPNSREVKLYCYDRKVCGREPVRPTKQYIAEIMAQLEKQLVPVFRDEYNYYLSSRVSKEEGACEQGYNVTLRLVGTTEQLVRILQFVPVGLLGGIVLKDK